MIETLIYEKILEDFFKQNVHFTIIHVHFTIIHKSYFLTRLSPTHIPA